MSITLTRAAIWFAVIAGFTDFATGIGLVTAPAFTLEQMGAEVPGREALLFVRFVGVFVAAVGSSYLWALANGSMSFLRSVFQLTVFFRVAAGSFTGIAVALHLLSPAWVAVTATDLLFVGVQAWFLAKGLGRDD
ncbi:MAG: hypothetical protein Q7S40_33065 [Opitutaceae bacterium]|nr:hypothetical protein [Opitutaceae bacterium]